jgi:hypothetical protein
MAKEYVFDKFVHNSLNESVEVLITAGIIEEQSEEDRYNWNAGKKSLAQIFKAQFENTPRGFWQAVAISFTCRGKPVTADQLKHLANKNGNGDEPKKSADFIRIQKILKLGRARRFLEVAEQSGYKNSEKIYEDLKDFFNEKVD